jgi:putative nucleotidyltransferase with HDIG domain
MPPIGIESLDRDEVERRLPTLQLISDPDLRSDTAYLSSGAPKYFWTKPATTSDTFHHPAAREQHGLWAHTLMLSTVIHRLSDSYVQRGKLTEREIDYAHAAAILHDQRKYGDPDRPEDTSTSHHDKHMADVVRQHGLPEEIAHAVDAHNGPWYDGKVPEEPLEDLVHTADMVASEPAITPGVQGPLPEELQGIPLEEVDLR